MYWHCLRNFGEYVTSLCLLSHSDLSQYAAEEGGFGHAVIQDDVMLHDALVKTLNAKNNIDGCARLVMASMRKLVIGVEDCLFVTHSWHVSPSYYAVSVIRL